MKRCPALPSPLSGRRHRRRGHERAMAHGRVALGPSAARMRPNTLPIVRRSQPFAHREALGAAAGWCAPTAFGRGPCRRLLRPHGRTALTAARRPNTPEYAPHCPQVSAGASRSTRCCSWVVSADRIRTRARAGARSAAAARTAAPPTQPPAARMRPNTLPLSTGLSRLRAPPPFQAGLAFGGP